MECLTFQVSGTFVPLYQDCFTDDHHFEYCLLSLPQENNKGCSSCLVCDTCTYSLSAFYLHYHHQHQHQHLLAHSMGTILAFLIPVQE